MTVSVILHPGEDGYIVARCPALKSCVSQGRTRDEVMLNIREAIELCLEDLAELGQPVPDTTKTLMGSIVIMR